MFKSIMVFIGVIVGFFALMWVAQGNDFFIYRFFAPKYEDTRRQVFEQTKSFNQGMIQELQNMQFEYAKADTAGKAAMSDVILHRAADYDISRLPIDLRMFIDQLKSERIK